MGVRLRAEIARRVLNPDTVGSDTESVRQCSGCGYLVPPAWEACKRCGADLLAEPAAQAPGAGAGSVGAPVPVGVPAGGRAAPAPPALGAAPASSPPPAFGAAPAPHDGEQPDWERLAAPVRLGFGVPPGPGVPPGTAPWAPPPVAAAPTRAGSLVWPLVLLVVLLLAAGGGAVAWWRSVGGEHVPESLRPYVDDGKGFAYTPMDARFSVTLPGEPEEISQTAEIAGVPVTYNFVMSSGADYALGVMWVDLPAGSVVDASAQLEDGAVGAATATDAKIIRQEHTTHGGFEALDAELDAPEGQGQLRMIVAGNRLYAAIAVTRDSGAPGFDRLVESLTVNS